MFKIKDGFGGQRIIVLPKDVVRLMEQHELCRTLHITEMGCFPRAAHHYRDRPEGAGEFIFIYCIDGKGWFEVNGLRKEATGSHFFIIPPGVPCRYGADEQHPWTIYWIHFKGERATLLAGMLGVGQVNSVEVQGNSRIEDRIRLFEEIYATLEHGYAVENLCYSQACLYHFLSTLMYLQQFRQAAAPDADREGSVVNMAIHYMRENMEKSVSLSDLAKFAGCTLWQLKSLFKQQTGMSPKHYLLHLKIREACDYLRHTDMKVNQLCHKVGFEDPLYFTRMFNSVMGCSPKEYRKQERG